ncbi:hypothetical protein QA597_11525 [Marinilabiliaceae bacterium ANBcel2]|nr:hypothetical protein [Marinilabiliaceae bacterium ANBcel2]
MIGLSRSIFTGGANSGALSGTYFEGFRSNSSIKIPSSVIIALIFLSALQLTP